ncbi:MAG: hypothetical protein K2N56_00620 [Oscillospiraceae bacterium]|nr:hypothetical protein [Oscillospiraceae bacterium]
MQTNKVDKNKAIRLMEVQQKMSDIYTRTQVLSFGSRDPSAEKELVREVRSLRESWFSVISDSGQITADTFSALENVCSGGNTASPQAGQLLDAFFQAVTEKVFIELKKWLDIYIYIYI